MLELTSSEVSSLPADTKVYEGVGKMYVMFDPVTSSLPSISRFLSAKVSCGVETMIKGEIDNAARFVYTPIPDVQKRLKAESEALTKEMSNLDKKEDYLEKTYTNSKNSLEQVLKGAS